MNEQALLAGKLESLLSRECKVYAQYLGVIAQEQIALKAHDLELLEDLTAKRAALYEIMMESQEIRLELMRSQPHKSGMTLRSWILESFEPQYSRRLMPLAKQLRELAVQAKGSGREHKEIIGFALKAVNGVLTQVWSATQNVVRSYTRTGKEREATNPQTRHSGVLKEA